MALNQSNEATLFADLKDHVGHDIQCVQYGWVERDGEAANIAIECHTCYCILLDADNPRWRVVHA